MIKIFKKFYSAFSIFSLMLLAAVICYQPANILSSYLNSTANIEVVQIHQPKNISVSVNTDDIISFFNRDKKENETPEIKNNNSFELFKGVMEFVKEGYVEDIDQDKLIEYALGGMIGSLDPHSAYLNAEELKEMAAQTKGEFGGLGIELTVENSLIKVISPIEGTPAYKIGIQAGDYISHIDDKPVIDMSLGKAVNEMRGKPGTKVKITVLRKGEDKPLNYTITRQIIKVQAVRSHREGDIAYIKINTFSAQAYPGLKKHLTKLITEIGQENIKGLVLDLRNNPGGLLDESISVAGAFLRKDDLIVSIKGREKNSEKIYKNEEENLLSMEIPMVVLINEGSASASEIVAGALQDNKRAVIMGIKSFGKGSVQSVTELNNGGAIRMTTARYYTPSGRSIQAMGVEPDIVVSAAKIEPIKREMAAINEADLKGHLENNDNQKEKESGKQKNNGEISSLYEQDYQLARAVDLLLGINLFDSKRLIMIENNNNIKGNQ